MGSCLFTRRRKLLRSVCQKLFLSCLVFMTNKLASSRHLTTGQWRDFAVPLSRERTKVARLLKIGNVPLELR